jgi:hypothetical protein
VTNITTSSLDNDAYEIPLTIRGKNLYNKEEYPLTSGIWINASEGNEGTGENLASTKNYIPCTDLRGKQITINHQLPTYYAHCSYFNYICHNGFFAKCRLLKTHFKTKK